MKKNHPFITGTILLTATGFLSRFIGFFYRTFLSRTFGAEGMGIYQLISPVIALTYSLTAAGIQTSVSKYTATETSTGNYKYSLRVLSAAFCLSMPLSFLCTFVVWHYSGQIASLLLLEPRTAPLLRIFALSIPFCAVHSIANGYFYGIKNAGIPAFCQILEQIVRVGSVYLICFYAKSMGKMPEIAVAAVGLTLEECSSALISFIAISRRFRKLEKEKTSFFFPAPSPSIMGKITFLAAPLIANRIIINLLQSAEAVSIPNRLIMHGFSHSQALSVYGILTGMALPLVLFPSAFINSACVMLLPVVSEADENKNHPMIHRVVKKSIFLSGAFGFLCTILLLLFGRLAGILLFKSEIAGSFIMTLSFICPLLYLSGSLSSILHGMGKTGLTFLFNVLSLSLRLGFVFFLIPRFGIQAYLWGLLFSQFLSSALDMAAVRYYLSPQRYS